MSDCCVKIRKAPLFFGGTEIKMDLNHWIRSIWTKSAGYESFVKNLHRSDFYSGTSFPAEPCPNLREPFNSQLKNEMIVQNKFFHIHEVL